MSMTDPLTTQERLLPFLLNPLSYPHRPRAVRLVQTHASFVCIAGPFVYKVKKPVNFGFLDFSTLEKRRHFCEREVALNRRLCPGVYLGVVPITQRNRRYAFGATGPVVEYAVQMRRLCGRGFLDRAVESGELMPGDLTRVAGVLKSFYEAQQPTEEIEAWGRIDRLRISTDENFRQTRAFLGHTLSHATCETIRSYTNRFYTRHTPLFASRIAERRIRDCHGDLHLEHIHLTPRALHIYDCIEFNDRFRYVDVASDIAFLAMDLDYRGRPDLARFFVRQIARALNDPDMLRLMDFYKCYRAYVRGKVESLHSIAPAAPEAERQESASRARRYFQLALHYAIAGSEPTVLAVTGRIASGKSTLAQALGSELGWEVYSSDHIRKKMAGFPLYERSSSVARKRLYSASMTEQTYRRLFAAAAARLKQNRNAILDATFAKRAQRKLLTKRFGKPGLGWRLIEACAPNAIVKQRLRAREARPEVISDARLEDFTPLNDLYEPPDELPARQRTRVVTNRSLDRTLAAALKSLAHLQADRAGAPGGPESPGGC